MDQHRTLGHINKEVLSYLLAHSSNFSINDFDLPEVYKTYKITKAKRQISRRPTNYTIPFEALYRDLIRFNKLLAKISYLSHSVKQEP